MTYKAVETYKKFKPLNFYMEDKQQYELFPFNFNRLENNSILLSNDIGEFIITDSISLEKIVKHKLKHKDADKTLFEELLNKQFIYIPKDKASLERKAIKYRTKKQFLYTGPVLHVFVVTTRCQHKCQYCQITPQSEKAFEYDMTPEIAKKSVEMMMESPGKEITVEFQGGETLLAFDIVKQIVLYTEEINLIKGKDIEYVLATSLVDITDEQLKFIKEYSINLSTSLDGPEDLHNKNRPIHSQNTYQKFKQGFELSKEYVGETVSPLLTVSKSSLTMFKEIINEYQLFGKDSISLRALSPYGFAVKTAKKIGYSVDEYLAFYFDALNYIIEMNLNGTYFREEYATLLLRRILTPYSTGYVDLQSPSGAGINALVYYYNGEVYPADEARMLAEMGDKNFYLGNVFEHSFDDIYQQNALQAIIEDSCAESMTGCNECAFLPYCGADPLFNYVTQLDHYGHRPSSDFCTKQTAIFNFLFEKIAKNDPEIMEVFWSWINIDSLKYDCIEENKND